MFGYNIFESGRKSEVLNYIIYANVVVFILQFVVPMFNEIFELTPILAVDGAMWQFVSYMFLHGSVFHIFINMYVLLIFGKILLRQIGDKRFLYLYFGAGIFSGLFHVVLAFTGLIPPILLANGTLVPAIFVPLIGASGAVFGIVTAFAFLFPDAPLIIFPIFKPIKAKWIIIRYIILSLVLGLSGILPGIGHFGHLGGIIAGLGLMLYWKRPKKRSGAHEFGNYSFVWE